MDRRRFVGVGGIGMIGVLLGCDASSRRDSVPKVTVDDLSRIGHLLLKNHPGSGQVTHEGEVEHLVVGGGISGLAALYALRRCDVRLLEMSHGMGGTSGVAYHGDLAFSTGAHYELPYPEYYGKDTLEALNQIGVIDFFTDNRTWEFSDREYLIDPSKESRCLRGGSYHSTPLAGLPGEKEFLHRMSLYEGRMPMPTRLIEPALVQQLDGLTFSEWLGRFDWFNGELRNGIDYQMRDDYGGSSAEVSALAGIHYYACRPYSNDRVQVFSPPEGNYYFARRILESAGMDKHTKDALVYRISRDAAGSYLVHYMDTNTQGRRTVRSRNVIYTGKKHALPHILDEELLDEVSGHLVPVNHAPWMVVNLVVPRNGMNLGTWQNDDLDGASDFLGVVDGDFQKHEHKNLRCLTAYYCLNGLRRKDLLSVNDRREEVAMQAIQDVSRAMGSQIGDDVLEVRIRVMGHAMPIPEPGYLSKGISAQVEAVPGLFLAGVDHGRLPLFFEAFDSGLQAGSLASSREASI